MNIIFVWLWSFGQLPLPCFLQPRWCYRSRALAVLLTALLGLSGLRSASAQVSTDPLWPGRQAPTYSSSPQPTLERLPPVEEEPLGAGEAPRYDPANAPADSWGEPSLIEPDASEAWLTTEPPETIYLEDEAVPARSRPMGPGGGMGGLGGGSRSPLSASAFWIPTNNLRDAPGDFSVHGENLQVMVPVAIGAGRFTSLSARVGASSYNTTAELPGSPGTLFPEQLWDINVGLMHVRELENGWSLGGMLNLGSASDKPFHSIDEMNLSMLAFLKVPAGERDAWNFALMYAPLGQLAFPIPGISYSWNPSDQFSMNIGLPFSLRYQPSEVWSYELSYLPVTNVTATVRAQIGPRWSLYGTFQTHSQGYQIANRADDEDRLYEFDQRLLVGSRMNLGESWALDFSGGYLMNRSYYYGDSFFDDDVGFDVENGALVQLRLEWIPRFAQRS